MNFTSEYELLTTEFSEFKNAIDFISSRSKLNKLSKSNQGKLDILLPRGNYDTEEDLIEPSESTNELEKWVRIINDRVFWVWKHNFYWIQQGQ